MSASDRKTKDERGFVVERGMYGARMMVREHPAAGAKGGDEAVRIRDVARLVLQAAADLDRQNGSHGDPASLERIDIIARDLAERSPLDLQALMHAYADLNRGVQQVREAWGGLVTESIGHRPGDRDAQAAATACLVEATGALLQLIGQTIHEAGADQRS